MLSFAQHSMKCNWQLADRSWHRRDGVMHHGGIMDVTGIFIVLAGYGGEELI
jgi:hypothetical protein